MAKPAADFVYRHRLPRTAVEELRAIIYDIKPDEVPSLVEKLPKRKRRKRVRPSGWWRNWEADMSLLGIVLLVVILLLLFGGGGYYGGWHSSYPGYYGGGIGLLGVVLIIIVVMALMGRGF